MILMVDQYIFKPHYPEHPKIPFFLKSLSNYLIKCQLWK